MSSLVGGDGFVDLSAPRRIHVSGVGGAGMSGIAILLHHGGHRVTGSDRSESPFLAPLRSLGIPISVGHTPEHILAADLVAVSVAVPETDDDLVAARSAGIPVVRRTVILAAVARSLRTIAVAGTHGKSSTSAMLAVVLRACGIDINYLVGATVVQLGGNAGGGVSDLFVCEADESDRSFLALGAFGAIVTNIEADHLDVYGSLANVITAFTEFIEAIRGPLVMCVDDPTAATLAQKVGAVTYGESSGAVFIVRHFEPVAIGSRCEVMDTRSGETAVVTLAVPGRHMALNAAGAIAMASCLGVNMTEAAAAVATYRGIGRRFESRGTSGGVRFFDDYAHMPAELSANLQAARDLQAHDTDELTRLVAVFQPHLFSRTHHNAAGFGAALSAADVVVLAPIYGARELPIDGVTAANIAVHIRRGVQVVVAETRADLAATTLSILRVGDLCLTFGAGDITSLADEIAALNRHDVVTDGV